MSKSDQTLKPAASPIRSVLISAWKAIQMPVISMGIAFILGAIVIWVTTGSLWTVVDAYGGLVRGAFFKQRGFSETFVATIPYVLLSLAVAVGFKTGLFNIGVEGQFYLGAVSAAFVGQLTNDLPAIIHLPLTLLAGMLGGAIWAAIPGFLKARFGAHEVINTIMMNYIAFRLVEYIVTGPLRDPQAGLVQTRSISHEAELWTLASFPARLQNPLNALMVALVIWFLVSIGLRWWIQNTPALLARFKNPERRRLVYLGAGAVIGVITYLLLPALSNLWWPFNDPYDRLHSGVFLAIFGAVFVWWLLWKTTLGFELRAVGANPNAAKYAGVNITRNIVLAMFISGAFAGLAGTTEVLGVSICRCLPVFFSSGYGFDSIAIALLAKNDPFGILGAAFLFGAMRNGADLMELSSGVSKHIISLIQATGLLFVAAPAILQRLFRLRASRKPLETEEPLTHGWGG